MAFGSLSIHRPDSTSLFASSTRRAIAGQHPTDPNRTEQGGTLLECRHENGDTILNCGWSACDHGDSYCVPVSPRFRFPVLPSSRHVFSASQLRKSLRRQSSAGAKRRISPHDRAEKPTTPRLHDLRKDRVGSAASYPVIFPLHSTAISQLSAFRTSSRREDQTT
jgi:hypothetical protein